MMKMPTLEDWVWVEDMLIQAMIGCITPNIRQIALQYKNDSWIIKVILSEDNEDDRVEIIDIADETSIFLEDLRGRISECAYRKVIPVIEVSDKPLDFKQIENQRLVYRRKETNDDEAGSSSLYE